MESSTSLALPDRSNVRRSSVVPKDRDRVKPERTPDRRIARGVCDDPDDESHRDQDCWVRRNHTIDDASNELSASNRETRSDQKTNGRHPQCLIQHEPFDRAMFGAKRDADSNFT